MLVAVGAAYGDHDGYNGHDEWNSYDGDYDGWDRHGGDHGDLDGHGGGKYIDWLNPGGYYYTSWYYPTYTNYWYYPTYTYYWYPEYTYTYPAYYNPAPVVNPAVPVYTTYYPDPLVYDPWYATNVYGWGGVTYYYTSSWTWSSHGGFFI